jgi:hypothetical protein
VVAHCLLHGSLFLLTRIIAVVVLPGAKVLWVLRWALGQQLTLGAPAAQRRTSVLQTSAMGHSGFNFYVRYAAY